MSTENTETKNTENDTNIVGKLDSKTLARRLAQTKTVRDMERNRRARRARNEERRIREEREAKERQEAERKAMEAAMNFMSTTPLAVAARELSQKLTAQREEAEQLATGRSKGRFVKKTVQKQALDTAAVLTELGF